MQKFVQVWRSYKAFLARGDVKPHSRLYFWELSFAGEGVLLLNLYTAAKYPVHQHKGVWSIQSEKRGRYLVVDSKPLYEVITWEENELVMQDSGEKLFFVPLNEWAARLNPVSNAVLNNHPITLWSKSLMELVIQ